MNTPLRYIPIALVAALVLATGVTEAFAQDYGVKRTSMREKRDAAREARKAKDQPAQEALYARFTAMESALASLNSQSAWLASLFNSSSSS